MHAGPHHVSSLAMARLNFNCSYTKKVSLAPRLACVYVFLLLCVVPLTNQTLCDSETNTPVAGTERTIATSVPTVQVCLISWLYTYTLKLEDLMTMQSLVSRTLNRTENLGACVLWVQNLQLL